MSHFAVMVALPPKKSRKSDKLGEQIYEEVDHMMAPFQENNMGDVSNEFLEFVNEEEEHQEQYNTDSWTGFAKEQKNGKRRFIFEMGNELREIKNNAADKLRKELKKDAFWGVGYPVPPEVQKAVDQEMKERGWQKITIPMKERYASFEEFMKDYCGYKSRDPENNAYGHWSNPNAHWDWWVIGGRWRGYLRIKERAAPIFGQRGAFDDGKEPDAACTSDAAYIEDVDFEWLDKYGEMQLEKFWANLSAHMEALKKNPKGHEDFNLRWQLADMGIVNGREPLSTYVEGLTIEKLKAEYLDHFRFGTYAALDENGWQAPGDMGWWGCSTDTPDLKKKHKASFLDWMKSKPPKTLFVVADCHI